MSCGYNWPFQNLQAHKNSHTHTGSIYCINMLDAWEYNNKGIATSHQCIDVENQCMLIKTNAVRVRLTELIVRTNDLILGTYEWIMRSMT